MELEVEWSELTRYVADLEACHRNLQAEYDRVSDCRAQLDKCMKTKSFASVSDFLYILNDRLDTCGWDVASLANTLETCIDLYKRYESDISGCKSEMISGTGDGGANNTGNSMFGDSKLDIPKWFSALIKLIDETSKLNVLGPVVGWLNEMTDFYEGLLTGDTDFGDWCKLTKESGGLWGAIYKYYEKNKIQFSPGMVNAAGAVSIIGAYFGLVGGYYDAIEKGTAGAYIKATGKGFDIGKAIAKFAGYEVSFNGGWFTLGGTIFSAGGQFVDSFQKYSADGNYDFKDFNDSMFDGSVAGLAALIKGATGGIVDLDADALMESVRGWGKDTGTSIGTRIKNNPEMRDKFNNGNFFDKICVFTWGIFA